MSPVFLRDCSVRLNPNLLSTSSSSKNLPHTNDSSLGLTSPERSESSPPAPKSPVFLKTDSKRCTKLSRGTLTDCTSHSSFKDNVHKSEDLLGGSSSHKKGDSPKSSSHGRKAPGTSHVPAPEDFVKLRQVKDEGEGSLSTLPDRAPDLKVSSCTDSKSLDEFTSHMVLHLSDDDDEDDEENDKIIPPSPVFPQDRSSHAGQTKLSPTQPCTSSSPPKNSTFQNKSNSQASEQTKALRKSADFKLTPTGKDEGLVSYYWGVPFCPKGQSPDDYTRVILTQLEVYEKSLKEAQRQLLHKVDWGLPVFPCPIERAHSRRLKRHRAPQLLEEEEEDERDEEEREKQKEMDESQPRSEEEAEDGQRETYVVVSSPETELEKSPSAFGQAEPSNSAKPSSSCRRPVSQEHFKDTEIQPEADENGEEVQNEGFDAESAVCPETQMSEDNTPELMVTSPTQPQMQAETDIMEVDELTEPPAEPEERMEQERSGEEQSWRESVPSQVECPMCSRLFPLCEIEMHAAYCNGSVEEQDHDHTQDQLENLSQGIARRKSIRRTAMEDDVRFEKSEQREKCFICEKFFVTKEYEQHVNQCIRQKSLGHKQGNGLLSALNRTETVHLDDSGAGPSNTAVKNNRSHSDASAKPADSQAPAYSVSTSPFKSFTPISEIKDCLIDFRQQHTDRTSQRLGRKRKFKR
ncbi:BRCA1-A complex subunit RAP80 isoform X3 [Silurus meridionalis]|uniref:BRCA1-A complex subunit RAP80 isoform X3 n=1 Tax=Silurus meridionalis TaxID=175797 RepID=UPI001EEB5893|nr:BRCA1-A complex subunit RAP80 isoform X3 [Silurus meridionalis]